MLAISFNAEKVAPELVDELKFDARWEERCKVIQAKLRERLPGIDRRPCGRRILSITLDTRIEISSPARKCTGYSSTPT
jgi:hypothetical protein